MYRNSTVLDLVIPLIKGCNSETSLYIFFTNINFLRSDTEYVLFNFNIRYGISLGIDNFCIFFTYPFIHRPYFYYCIVIYIRIHYPTSSVNEMLTCLSPSVVDYSKLT